MKSTTKALYITKFLRGFPDVFTVDEMISYLKYLECKISKTELKEILKDSPYLFKVSDNTYVTRAAVFSGQCFTVCLTKEEVNAQCFLPGHRLMPFVDQDALSSTLSFCYKKKELPKKIVTFSKQFAYDHFSLYGIEYGSQYIVNDPGMRKYDFIDNDFDLPEQVTLQCVDLSEFFKKNVIKPGDRLLIKVEDWPECILSIEPIVRKENSALEITQDDIERSKWYHKFEDMLLNSFDSIGPCSSIEEQLANVYFENMNVLAKKNSGSIEEFLEKTTKVSVEFFGVETRLWKKGEMVPVLGAWNCKDDFKNHNPYRVAYNIPEFILDEYLKDYAYTKKDNLSKLITDIFPSSYYISEEYKKSLLLHIETRNDIILANYNWFADFKLGQVRNLAISLYTRISNLAYEIDRVGEKVKKYPQQELIVLIQLYAHITNLLETIAFEPQQILCDLETILLSLEGMEINFEDICPELQAAIYVSKQEEFKVIK